MAGYTQKIQIYLVYLFLGLFALGHLPSLFFDLIGIKSNIVLIDIPVVLLSIFALPNLRSNRTILGFVSVLIFSWIFSSSIFGNNIIWPGLFYLLRLISYLLFAISVRNLVVKKLLRKEDLKKALLLIGLLICIIGLSQYLLSPDIRNLKLLGWDDHYFRLSFPFLDPAFTGIILVLSALLAFTKKAKILFVLFVVALFLTYSRASFLSLFAALVFLIPKSRILKTILVSTAALIIFVLSIPNVGGEGVNLLRTNSAVQKYGNLIQSIEVIKFSPIFGIGYNNSCLAKQEVLGLADIGVHSCSGFDNSFLYIAATTGLVGLFGFIAFIAHIWKSSSVTARASLLAVGIHGLFTNTYVYPWVMGWLFLVWAMEFRQSTRP